MPTDDEQHEQPEPYTGPERRTQLAEAAGELNLSVGELTGSVRELASYSRRSRQLIYATAIGLLLDLILSVALIVVAVQSNHASHQAAEATSAAARNRENQRVTCEAGNQARVAQIQLWTYVLDLSARQNPHPTPEQAKRIADFRTYINQVFAPRDCANTASPTVQPPTTPPTR